MALGKLKCDTIENEGGSSITVANLVTLDTSKANLSGATFTGDVLLDNEQELRLGEADANGTNYVALKAPATLNQTSTWTMPADVPAADQYLKVTSVANTNDPTLEWATVTAGVTWTNTLTFDGDDSWTSIPSGVSEIFVIMDTTFSDGQIAMQLGNSGGFVSSGYTGRSVHLNPSPGAFQTRSDSWKIAYGEGHSHIGLCRVKKRQDSNDWVMTTESMMDDTGSGDYYFFSTGKVNSGGTLDRVRIYRTAGSAASGTLTLGYA